MLDTLCHCCVTFSRHIAYVTCIGPTDPSNVRLTVLSSQVYWDPSIHTDYYNVANIILTTLSQAHIWILYVLMVAVHPVL